MTRLRLSSVRRLIMVVAAVAGLVVGGAGAAQAHPLGNFTVNTYSGLVIGADAVAVDFVVDMAEVPAFQVIQELGGDQKVDLDAGQVRTFEAAECAEVQDSLSLRADGRRQTLRLADSTLTFPEGQAGLKTLRLGCLFEANLNREPSQIVFENQSYADRVGWREITVAGDRMTVVSSDAQARSISQRLTRYPDDLLLTPPDQRSAGVTLRPGGAAAPAAPAEGRGGGTSARGVDQLTEAFVSFVGRQDFSLPFAAAAFGLSIVLGAAHALAPGHGKTVMAAYLVGQKGTVKQAAMVGLIVTITHTAGVLALGIAISASVVLAPEAIYPWLGLTSGLLLTAIGGGLFVRARGWRRTGSMALPGHDDHDHSHEPHDHDHSHEPHDHGHDHSHEPHGHEEMEPERGGLATLVHSHGGRSHSHGPIDPSQPLTWATLFGMGLVGGFLPSPSAVVVLLGAIALGRTWFGVLLVIAYGLGMAATLTGVGLLLLKARDRLERVLAKARSARLLRLSRSLPVLTGALIVVVGVYLSVRAAVQI